MYKAIFSLTLFFSFLSLSAQWTHKHYVDDFGDKSEDSYIVRVCTGTFSNSATSNSKLTVQCLVEVQDSIPRFRFVLFEYGSQKVKNLQGNTINLKIKLADGTMETFSLFGSGQSAILSVSYSKKLIKIMKKESKLLKVYIGRSDDYSESTYNFTISPIGFTNAINKLYKIDSAKNE
jgi:hypothetical protein